MTALVQEMASQSFCQVLRDLSSDIYEQMLPLIYKLIYFHDCLLNNTEFFIPLIGAHLKCGDSYL